MLSEIFKRFSTVLTLAVCCLLAAVMLSKFRLNRAALDATKLPLSPLIRLRGYRQRVFKWGVGTSHSLRNNLKQLPPTIPHPKEKTITKDYFSQPAENIKWCKINEQWEVFWYEFEKLHAKPFPVRKFGVERSKSEALVFSEQLRASGRMHARPNYTETTAANVFWDERMQAWFATYTDETGRPRSSGYSAGKWGFDISRQKAIEKSKSGLEGAWLSLLDQK